MSFKKIKLKCGVTLLYEQLKGSHTLSVGYWVQKGTRDEPAERAGICHLTEHMIFKGTRSRTAFEIAASLERLGGDLNAYTTKEYTVVHAHVLNEHWKVAVDVLSDLVFEMKARQSDLDLEKAVVIQEIAMTEDQLDELVFDEFFKYAFQGNEFAIPILGTNESVAGTTLQDINSFYIGAYAPESLILSISGDVPVAQIVEFAEKRISKGLRYRAKEVPLAAMELTPRQPRRLESFSQVLNKKSEQVHLVVGLEAPHFKDEYRFEAFIINALLGGGMTSRLFQKIREEKGLAYSVYSQLSTFTDMGLFLIHAAASAPQLLELIEAVQKELLNLAQKTISASEIKMFQTQVRGSLLMSADDVESRMSSIAVNEMVFGRYRSVQSVIDEVEEVSVKSVRRYVKERFSRSPIGLLVMGNLPDKAKVEARLQRLQKNWERNLQ